LLSKGCVDKIPGVALGKKRSSVLLLLGWVLLPGHNLPHIKSRIFNSYLLGPADMAIVKTSNKNAATNKISSKSNAYKTKGLH